MTFRVLCTNLYILLCMMVCAQAQAQAQGRDCQRIVSLAPSVTESLFAIGLGDSVVGVTRYDTYPPEVQTKKNIGGFLDPSIETIFSLKPTIAFGVAEQQELASSLRKINIKTDLLEHRNMGGILSGMTHIGEVCHCELRAGELRNSLEKTLNEVKEKTRTQPVVRVVIVVSRNYENPTLKDLYLSGEDGYYNTLLDYAGGRNIFTKALGSISATSLEGLVSLDPDVIIEVLPTNEIAKISKSSLMQAWNSATMLKAVRNNKVFMIDNDWATIPGPRFIEMLKAFLKILHPEVT